MKVSQWVTSHLLCIWFKVCAFCSQTWDATNSLCVKHCNRKVRQPSPYARFACTHCILASGYCNWKRAEWSAYKLTCAVSLPTNCEVFIYWIWRKDSRSQLPLREPCLCEATLRDVCIATLQVYCLVCVGTLLLKLNLCPCFEALSQNGP